MSIENEKYFGDKNSFAIRYVPGYSDQSKKYFYANCHLVLNGQIIGDKKEVCYLNSWKYSLESLLDHIRNHFKSIQYKGFNLRNDRELFELILKSNQLEENYKPAFEYLPVLDSDVWENCNVSLDETTDAFTVLMSEQNGDIKFLWEGYRKPCPSEKLNLLFSTIAKRQDVISAIEKCLETIEKEYLDFPIKLR